MSPCWRWQVYVTLGTGPSAMRGHCPRDLLSATQLRTPGSFFGDPGLQACPWTLWTFRNQSPKALSPAMEIAQGEFGATLCLLFIYFLVPGTQNNLGPFWFLFRQSGFLGKALGASCLVEGTSFFTVRKSRSAFFILSLPPPLPPPLPLPPPPPPPSAYHLCSKTKLSAFSFLASFPLQLSGPDPSKWHLNGSNSTHCFVVIFFSCSTLYPRASYESCFHLYLESLHFSASIVNSLLRWPKWPHWPPVSLFVPTGVVIPPNT